MTQLLLGQMFIQIRFQTLLSDQQVLNRMKPLQNEAYLDLWTVNALVDNLRFSPTINAKKASYTLSIKYWLGVMSTNVSSSSFITEHWPFGWLFFLHSYNGNKNDIVLIIIVQNAVSVSKLCLYAQNVKKAASRSTYFHAKIALNAKR